MITNILMIVWLMSPPPIPDLTFLAEMAGPPAVIQIQVEKEKVIL